MRYVVTEKFYNMVSALVAVAIEDESAVEYDIAVDLIRDLATKE